MLHDEDLTPEEAAELEALPRERMPSKLLEERTVQMLRQEGLIRAWKSPRWPSIP